MNMEIFSSETSTVKTTTCTDKVVKELRIALQTVTQIITQNTNTDRRIRVHSETSSTSLHQLRLNFWKRRVRDKRLTYICLCVFCF